MFARGRSSVEVKMPPTSEELAEDGPQQQSSLASVSLSEPSPSAGPPGTSSADSTPTSRKEEDRYGYEEGEEGEQGRATGQQSDPQPSRSASCTVEELLATAKTSTTLTPAQVLDQHKSRVKLFVENERYLRRHHELGDMLELFVKCALEQQPENLLKFAGTFFTQPNLKEAVEAYSRNTVVRPDNRDISYGL